MPLSTSLNNATSTLASDHIGGSDTLVLASGTGTRFGTPTVDAPITVTVARRPTMVNGRVEATTTHTIFEVTARSGDTLSGLTAVEGTSDRNYYRGDPAEASWTAGMYNDLAAVVTDAAAEATAAAAAVAGKADNADVVHRTGAESIDDIKTFTERPILSGGANVVTPVGALSGLELKTPYVVPDDVGGFMFRMQLTNYEVYSIPEYFSYRIVANRTGELLLNSSLVVSGVTNETVDRGYSPTPPGYAMVGFWSDVAGPSLITRGNGVTGNYQIGCISSAGYWALRIGDNGELIWSDTEVDDDYFGPIPLPDADITLTPLPAIRALAFDGTFFTNRLVVNGTDPTGVAFTVLDTTGANAFTVDPAGNVVLRGGQLAFNRADGASEILFNGDGITHSYKWYRPAGDPSVYLQDATTGLLLVTYSGGASAAVSIVTFNSRLTCGELTAGSGFFTGPIESIGVSAGITIDQRSGGGAGWAIYDPSAGELHWYSLFAGGDRMTLTQTGNLSVVGSLTAGTVLTLSATVADSAVPNNSFFRGSDHAGALCYKNNSGAVSTVNLTPV